MNNEIEQAKKALEREKKQYKRQNEYIKKNYFRQTVIIKNDIKERLNNILQPGESMNGLINQLLLDELEKRERLQDHEDHEEKI